MNTLKRIISVLFTASLLQAGAQSTHIIHPLSLRNVKVTDSFWSPKYKVWNTKTVYDVFDKLEGKYEPDRPDIIREKEKMGRTRNAFLNFDLVAQGKTNINTHDGPPWYDGLVYETIRGAADLLVTHPDPALEKKIDTYIDRIAAAQAVDPNGYINTYTTLTRPDKRWGTNGGDDKWQHDIYNSGMLTEAAVHYYYATGKTKLLTVAVKLDNYIYTQMGPAPKQNIIPGHAGPEEALLKLYQLFKQHPELKTEVGAPVNEQQYFDIAKYWIEQRGNYSNADGGHARRSDSSYNQDHMPVLQQPTIEGHAVRATLLATGVTDMALLTGDARYIQTANRYWDNMIGKRLFITGGEGAIADGERFGPDYHLPESAYLETCASIGSAFFSGRMNELEADGKYMDEFERVVYNNLLSGVSLDGTHYHYENPLTAESHPRWAWHDCPCCPPMILKMAGTLPQYIYATDSSSVWVNLFIGSEATVPLHGGKALSLSQRTGYPWKGRTRITIGNNTVGNLTLHIRIPGWAENKENPFGLYTSQVSTTPTLTINGKAVSAASTNGYATITRQWKKGDVVELRLPMEPRVVTASDSVQTLKGKAALASGPIIYAFEGVDNADMQKDVLFGKANWKMDYQPSLLNGVNIITGTVTDKTGKSKQLTAVPFYSVGNRGGESPYSVWLEKN